MHHHLRSAPSPPASPGTSIRRFYASGLIEAAEAGQLEEVEQALSRGIPVNSQTKHGTTALMKACEKGHLDIIRKLLAAGADAAVTNHFGETAATLAAASNQPEAALLRVLAALLTAALLGAIVLYSQRPGLAPAAPPLDFEPL